MSNASRVPDGDQDGEESEPSVPVESGLSADPSSFITWIDPYWLGNASGGNRTTASLDRFGDQARSKLSCFEIRRRFPLAVSTMLIPNNFGPGPPHPRQVDENASQRPFGDQSMLSSSQHPGR